MNQQQLQIARAALWRQNAAPLETYDDVAPWFEEIGFCLFLPRHAQFPSPAPSFVEACMGAPSATPPPAAIQKAMELATRLIDAGRAIPLNLLGTFSEQPDFLVAPEVLPWVAAIRGDRQWKTAPGGRTAPIVMRTWEALEKNGAQTALELREALGREVTEAAVLRALIELWTTLRALPLYTAGEATRWQLTKERYAAQLTTGSNTAQPTAVSALASLYLRSAVAATAEEAEVFLSPLTARSRIRDVLHGMMAARQFATMSVGSQTLLFVEGSLPEVAPVAEEEVPPAATREREGFKPRRAAEGARHQRPQPSEREKRRPDQERRGPRPDRERRDRERQDRGFPSRREFRPAASGEERRRGERPRNEGRPPRPFQKKRAWDPRPGSARPGNVRPGTARPGDARPGNARFEKPRTEGGREERPGRREDRGERKPWQKRPGGPFQKREGRPPFRKPFGKREERPERGPEGREERPRFGKGPRPQFGGKKVEGRPPRREAPGENRPPRPGKTFGGKPRFGKPGGRPERRGFGGNRPERGARGGFRPGPKGRGKFSPKPPSPRSNPRKNRGEKPAGEEGTE